MNGSAAYFLLVAVFVGLAFGQSTLPCPPSDLTFSSILVLPFTAGANVAQTTFDLTNEPYIIDVVDRVVVSPIVSNQSDMISLVLSFNGVSTTLLDNGCPGTLWINTFNFRTSGSTVCQTGGNRAAADGNLSIFNGMSAQGVWTLTATYNGFPAAGAMTVRLDIDLEPSSPQIDCYDANVTNDPGVCGADVYYREPDTCSTGGTAVITRSGLQSGEFFNVGTTSVSYRLTVGSASDSCTTSVVVTDNEPPVVTGCPANIVVAADPGPTCGAIVNYVDAVQRTDNCAVTGSSQTNDSGDFFPVGITNVVYTANDSAGNVGACSFTVTVTDAAAPVFSGCPGDVTETSSCNDAGTAVSWSEPSLTSDCLSYRAQNFSPGDNFPDGVTTVAYVAIQGDASSTCVFDVIVEPCQGEAGANRPPGAFGTIDLDGDGYFSDAPLFEWRDCCDSPEDHCDDPFMVNPGAFEIPHNGQEDSCRGVGSYYNYYSDADSHSGGCDFQNQIRTSLIGPTISASQTEPVAVAMDLCEFKDDDDDPSWGFGRQKSLTFALANGTRNGYDIGIDGPSVSQASVLRNFGKITPAKGNFMVAMSTGSSRPQSIGGFVPPTPGFATGSTAVNVPATFLDGGLSDFNEDCAMDQYAIGLDSIKLNMDVYQPTNMNGFSLQVLYLDNELEALQGSYPADGFCAAERQSWFLAIKSDSQTGVSRSGNFAGDSSGRSFNSFNDNPDFWKQCRDFDESTGACAQGHRDLADTGYGGASGWTTIGTSAAPGERFTLDLVTFEGFDSSNDVLVLIDDFFPVTEARTKGSSAFASDPWGYQYRSDLEMVFVGPANNAYVVPRETTSTVTIDFTIRNWGPEEANDIFVSFTPPVGTSFASAKDSSGSNMVCSSTSMDAPFAANGFHKCQFRSNPTMAAQTSMSGSVSFDLDFDCEACESSIDELSFRLTASLSSVDEELGNNYLTTAVAFI